MAVTTTYTFTVPENYDYGSDVEIISGAAQLSLLDHTGQTYDEEFSDDTGFTYNASLSEFTGGSVRQVDKITPGMVAWATYTENVNINFGSGTLEGVAIGGAAVEDSRLDLTGDTVKYVEYVAELATVVQQAGAIKFKVTPNYSGIPTTSKVFTYICKENGSTINEIAIFHQLGTGLLRINVRDASGTTIATADGFWEPSALTTYEIEANWDVTAGETRIYLDGILHGSDLVGTGTRSDDIGLFRAGMNATLTTTSDHYLEDIVLYNTVQHTGASYTPGYVLYEGRYSGDVITLPAMTYSGPGVTQAFTNIVSTEANAPRYVINDRYYSGGWVASSSTWATASPISTILTNIATLPASDSVIIKAITRDSNLRMSISDLTLTFTSQAYSTANPTICPISTLTAEDLLSFEATVVETGDDTVTFTIDISGTEYYWNGVEWSTGGNYANSNTAAVINANVSTLSWTGSYDLKFIAYLHSDDALTTPKLDSLSITYDLHGDAPGDPSICAVYGYIYDIYGNAMENVVVKAVLTDVGMYDTYLVVSKAARTAVTNSEGYWDMSLIENETMQAGIGYTFSFSGEGLSDSYNRVVPNQTSANWVDLETL